jgi:hypothetical protein
MMPSEEFPPIQRILLLLDRKVKASGVISHMVIIMKRRCESGRFPGHLSVKLSEDQPESPNWCQFLCLSIDAVKG